MSDIQYRVRLGDTLSKIALRYETSVDELAKLNRIGNVKILWVGQELKIPVGRAIEDARRLNGRQFKTPNEGRPGQITDRDEHSRAKVSRSEEYSASLIRSPYDPGMEIMSFGRVRNVEGVNLREAPKSNGVIQKKVSFNARVFVSHKLLGDWYAVALDDGCFGYLASDHVSIHPPEPNALLHVVKPNQGALEIVGKYYKRNAISWGRDERYYVNALVEANQGKGLRGIYKPEASAGWDETRTRAGYLIWVPSPEFADGLRSKVRSGSISYEAWHMARQAAEALGDFILGGAAFSAGLIHGILESLWDLLTGIVDLVELCWKVFKSLVAGELLSDLSGLWKFIEEMNFQALVDVGLESFRARWCDEIFVKKWHFRGWVVGYAVAEILMMVVTGAGAVVKWAGKAGRFSKVIGKFPKVLKLAEKVTVASKNISKASKQRILSAMVRTAEKLPGKKFTAEATTAQKVDARRKALAKSVAAAVRADAEYKAAAKKLRAAFLSGKLYSGLDPLLVAAMFDLGYAAAKRGIRKFDVAWQALKADVEWTKFERAHPEGIEQLKLAFKQGMEHESIDEATLARLNAQRSKRPTVNTVLERKALRRAIAGETSDFMLSFKNGDKGLVAELKGDGVVELMVRAGKDSPMRGSEMFEVMVEHFGSKMKAVRGAWTYGDNLGEVNKLTAHGLSLEEAILKTYTCRWAAEWGFSRVRLEFPPPGSPRTPGAYKKIYVLFEE